VNTTTTAAFPDVDAARIQWLSKTEGSGSWDDQAILNLCHQIQRQVNSPRSSNLKLYNISELTQQIEDTIKAKAS
jgi:hypothetical protein